MYESYMKGLCLNIETCGLDLFNISMENLKPCYLLGVASFLSQGDRFKLVGLLLLTLLKVCTKIHKS